MLDSLKLPRPCRDVTDDVTWSTSLLDAYFLTHRCPPGGWLQAQEIKYSKTQSKKSAVLIKQALTARQARDKVIQGGTANEVRADRPCRPPRPRNFGGL